MLVGGAPVQNAERLVNADSRAEYARVATQIHQNAALWARLIATPQQPGYRDRRDAYCQQQLAG